MSYVIKVGVCGAAGRMGRMVCAAVAADPELELVAAVETALPGVFTPVESRHHRHVTPAGREQQYQFTILRKEL